MLEIRMKKNAKATALDDDDDELLSRIVKPSALSNDLMEKKILGENLGNICVDETIPVEHQRRNKIGFTDIR